MNSFRLRLTCLLLLLLPPLLSANNDSVTDPVAERKLQAYAALGSDFATSTRLAELGWNDEQLNAFMDGMRASFRGKPYPFDHTAQQLQGQIGQRLAEIKTNEEKKKLDFSRPGRVQAFLKEVAKEYGLQFSDSGLVYALKPNGGTIRPGPDDTVVVTFQAVAADQRTDLPQISAQHQRCKVSDLLPGLAEGVQMLTASGSAMLVVPPDLLFGEAVWPAGVARGEPVFFTVMLHQIVAQP